MDTEGFKRCKASLPTHGTVSRADVSRLNVLYPKVLLAMPQQKRHKVSPAELQRLDTQRYESIPASISSRRQSSEGSSKGKPGRQGHITKSELQELMAWKLARGVYRPTLPSLIAQNEASFVEETSQNAFETYATSESGNQDGKSPAKPALDILCRLKGVGPATASLILSTAFPLSVPFFSDEIYYFYAAHDRRLEKIRYNLAEYAIVEEGVRQTQRRNEGKGDNDGDLLRTDDIERATYVVQKLQNPDVWEAALGKEGLEEGAATAIEKIVKGKDEQKKGRRARTQQADVPPEEEAAELEEAAVPTDQDPSLTERQKDQVREVKKAVIAESGGTIKHVNDKKRKSVSADEERVELRRSLRSSKRQER